MPFHAAASWSSSHTAVLDPALLSCKVILISVFFMYNDVSTLMYELVKNWIVI